MIIDCAHYQDGRLCATQPDMPADWVLPAPLAELSVERHQDGVPRRCINRELVILTLRGEPSLHCRPACVTSTQEHRADTDRNVMIEEEAHGTMPGDLTLRIRVGRRQCPSWY
jgi:hypothetical protein